MCLLRRKVLFILVIKGVSVENLLPIEEICRPTIAVCNIFGLEGSVGCTGTGTQDVFHT